VLLRWLIIDLQKFKLTGLNIKEIEDASREFWRMHDVPRLWRRFEEGKPVYSFLEGPPTVNGFPHVGHIRGRTYKDVVLRYYRLKGYTLWAQGGWDEQGLPVELEVEKKLKLKTKRDIESIGFERFSEECDGLVNYYLRYWRDIGTERLGLWLDLENAYETRNPRYIEHTWAFIKYAWEKGLLFEDYRVLAFCPRCETALSDAEVDLGYEERVSPSVYVKFKVEDSEDTYIVVWTTTPWTLIDDEAVAVHPLHDYVKVRVSFGGRVEYWIVAEALLPVVASKANVKSFEVVERFKGSCLEGLRYIHPLMDEVEAHRKHVHRVVTADFVTVSEGSGLVHIAPAHGPEDYELSRSKGIEFINSVEVNGLFNDLGGVFKGLYVEEAGRRVLEVLRSKNLLLHAETLTHSYPHCWRCGTPLIYRADKQYFLRITAVRDRMVEELKRVNIYPEKLRDRFDNWVAGSRDWCLSRSRVWGTPLPLWRNVKNGGVVAVGSIDELKSISGDTSIPDGKLVHRPWIDRVKLFGSDDWVREPYVVDVWLDSGVSWIAGVDGLRNRELWSRIFPFDFVTEAIDQTRGWFYSLLASSVLWIGKAPYKNVLIQGLVLDKYGQKMSKSKGNVLWAEDLFNRYGVDPVRLYILVKTAPWDDIAFNPDEVDNVKTYLTILLNILRFADTYMELDRFNPVQHSLEKLIDKALPEDLWILSSFYSTVRAVDDAMSRFELHVAVRSILEFTVEHLSHRYIRLIRRRVWREDEENRYAAYAILYHVLKGVLVALSPFIPHISEYLYQAFIKKYEPNEALSIHLSSWPKPEEKYINPKLEDTFNKIFEIYSEISSIRNRIGVKLRWPLKEAYIAVKDRDVADRLREVRQIIEFLGNIKHVEIVSETPEVCLTPDFETVSLSWCTVSLNKRLSRELYYESLARELIRRIQVMRNKMNLNVDEVVNVAVDTLDSEVSEALRLFGNYIMEEVRAETITAKITENMYVMDWDIEGKKVRIGVEKPAKH
jgi:isoleucyl-tRNA synthetase